MTLRQLPLDLRYALVDWIYGQEHLKWEGQPRTEGYHAPFAYTFQTSQGPLTVTGCAVCTARAGFTVQNVTAIAVNTGYAVIDGFIIGFIISWFYNRFAGQ